MSLIEIKNLTKEYPDAVPFSSLDATVEKGDVICIIGPSGTGKSTLLRCLNRLETPSSGSITVDGTDILAEDADLSEIRRNMGMVFQSFNLFPHMMAVENIMKPQESILGISRKEAYEKAMNLLELVGLKSKARKYPDELSGGQKQRVAIARALAMDPKIMLFDEPTSALDPAMVSEIISVIKELKASGLTMIIVTHEMRLAREVATRIFFMDEGGIYEQGTPEDIFTAPEKEKTRNFIFRIRSWEYEFFKEGTDYYEMLGSLEEFLRKQDLERDEVNKCIHAVEEVSVNCLNPYVEKNEESVRIVLNVTEDGREKRLVIAADNAAEREDEILCWNDDISRAIFEKMTRKVELENTERLLYEII